MFFCRIDGSRGQHSFSLKADWILYYSITVLQYYLLSTIIIIVVGLVSIFHLIMLRATIFPRTSI